MTRIVISVMLGFWLAVLPTPPGRCGQHQPFSWNRDQLWSRLEQRFVAARAEGCDHLVPAIRSRMEGLNALTGSVGARPLPPSAPVWEEAEQRMLDLAPLVAACPDQLAAYADTVVRLQKAVKGHARQWPAETPESRRRLYRLLYGGRTAVEEILLQAPDQDVAALWQGGPVPSAAPTVEVHGVALHSGDMLVSRGGAATSALIARGSDYPGNFSHVSLLHVDENTGKASVIEALIESGVQVHSAEEYLEDKKFRIMVLRLRPDLPLVVRNPVIAHQAARWAYESAHSKAIDYDFEMNFHNHDKLFCSEVIYAAYETVGVSLWSGLSHISAPGTAQWLESFGVKNFITLEPSDLEYDPQLIRVAEWRNPVTMFEDHVHNAVTDAMLEGANAGEPVGYNRLMLPVAWGLKAYSALKNQFGSTGPIPKGMDPKAALRSRWYSQQHQQRVNRVMMSAGAFMQARGYRPPYWELVRMARTAGR